MEEAFPFVSANPIFNENSIQIQYLIKTNIRKAAEKGGTVVIGGRTSTKKRFYGNFLTLL